MFNTNAQCYQNISQVLLTSAFILWPTCTRGFGIREKIRCGLRFFGVFLCGFAVFGPPLHPPPCRGSFPVDFHYLEGRGAANTKKNFNCMFKNSSIVRQPKGLIFLLVTCR